MRRLFHLGVIALLLSGSWGMVLAAAFCPRAQGHACCLAKSSSHEHELAATHHEMMSGMEGMAATSVADGNTLAMPPAACVHCLSHSGIPSTTFGVTNVSGQFAREMSAAAPGAAKSFVPLAAASAPPVISRQHGPPAMTTARHILISVFLI